MRNFLFFSGLFAALILTACTKKANVDSETDSVTVENVIFIEEPAKKNIMKKLIDKFGAEHKDRIEIGVKQAASLWRRADGAKEDFEKFCLERFVADPDELNKVFEQFARHMEVLYGNFNKMSLELKEPMHLSYGDVHEIDLMFGAYAPGAHLSDDLYQNKIAFLIALNFPTYDLKQKNELGGDWDVGQWSYARTGDVFIARVPADLQQNIAVSTTKADNYISNYNIFVGELLDKEGSTLFPKGMKLLSHWNLRDEIKSQYANEDGLPRQEMIYEVMLKIINQEIPEKVINSEKYQWAPFANEVFENGKKVEFKPEPNTRYQMLLNNFHAMKDEDAYNPHYPTYIKRRFEMSMEIPQEKVEELFEQLVSSPQVKSVAKLIEKRLGRKLQPFDIWYDGFKARSSFSQEKLDGITTKKYPNPEAFDSDIPNMLLNLGFKKDKADFIASKIVVDPARGSGHAWGASMKSDVAHLRTRVGKGGMDYKGYNIAVHELGHNVEQTITLHDVPNYMLHGVPNTAFTETWAFIFQSRDLELLGLEESNPNKEYLTTLDNFWSVYEIMGVSLVDMKVWKWMYENPTANAEQLKKAVIDIAVEVWNKYYAPALGVKDSPILAVYSHMIDNPLYLSAYPVGHLVEFQIEDYIEGKNLADEMVRMLSQGKLTPRHWMLKAIGEELSVEPIIGKVDKAVEAVSGI